MILRLKAVFQEVCIYTSFSLRLLDIDHFILSAILSLFQLSFHSCCFQLLLLLSDSNSYKFFYASIDLCIPYSSLLTKSFYFLVTLCRFLRTFLWAARLKNLRSAVNPHQLDCPFPFPYCICMLLLGVYILLENAKFVSGQGIPKEKPLPRLPFSACIDFES